MTRIIGVIAGKGGAGKTTVATNLACALGLLNKKVCLVDFNFTTSHLAIELGIIPQITLNNVLRNEVNVEKALYPCFDIHILPTSLNLSDLTDVDLSNLKSRMKRLLENFEIVVLDSAPGFGKEAISTIRASDEDIIVANPTLTSIADVLKCKQLVLQLRGNPLGIIVNKYKSKRFELKPEEISVYTELPLLGVIKEDESFLKSEAARIPLIYYKRNKAEEIMKLACLLTGKKYKKPSFFGRFFRRFSSNFQ